MVSKEQALLGGDYKEFHKWIEKIDNQADALLKADSVLKGFVMDRQAEIQRVVQDYKRLVEASLEMVGFGKAV